MRARGGRALRKGRDVARISACSALAAGARSGVARGVPLHSYATRRHCRPDGENRRRGARECARTRIDTLPACPPATPPPPSAPAARRPARCRPQRHPHYHRHPQLTLHRRHQSFLDVTHYTPTSFSRRRTRYTNIIIPAKSTLLITKT